MKKKHVFFRFFILKYLFYKRLLMLRESEEYFQIVDMPREKDQVWQQFTEIFSTVGMAYGTLR